MSSRSKVLLIDDDELIADGLRELLDIERIDLHVHQSLITVPFAMRRVNPDLILLDLGLPALSGEALLERGAHRVLRTDAPIILFSGRSRHELSCLAEQFGADGFIAKNDDILDSIRKIKLWLENRRVMKGASHAAARTASSSAK